MQVGRAPPKGMQVFVRLAEGRTIVVAGCGAGTTVESFESAVQARCGGLADARLAYGSKQLTAGRTLGDYNLQEGSTVEQLVRLRGGGVRARPKQCLSAHLRAMPRSCATPPQPTRPPRRRAPPRALDLSAAPRDRLSAWCCRSF